MQPASARATNYITTQTQSLQIGDTIATTGTGTDGYGMWSKAGATLDAPGNNTITTTGDNAHGLLANSQSVPGSNINAIGMTITVGGSGAYAATVQNGSAITLQGITANANGQNGKALYIDFSGTANVTDSTFVSAQDSAIELAGSDATLTIDGSIITANGDNTYGLRILNGSAATVTGATRITTTGDNSSAVWSNSLGLNTGGTIPGIGAGVSVFTSGIGSIGVIGTGGAGRGVKVAAATVVTQGDNANGARARNGGTVILNETHVTTHGANAGAAAVGSSAANDINSILTITGATLTTTGSGSNAVQIYGATNDITMDAATTLSTSGDGSHGISLQGGVTKIFNDTDLLPGSISVTGTNSAAFHARDTGTTLAIDGANGAVLPTITLGTDAWTLLAENGGTIRLDDISTAGGGIWARGETGMLGNVQLKGNTAAVGARLRADDNGIIDIMGITDKTGFSVGSLLGDSGRILLGDTNLTIDGNAVTTFGGHFTGAASLIRGGTNGSLTLTGNNTAFTSEVKVTGGGLHVDGSIGGKATVTGGVLGGSGTVGGDVAASSGGSLAGRQGQILSIGGNLAIAGDGIMTVALGAPEVAGTAGLFNVTGDVALDGKLNITNQGGFAPGLYRIIDYTGTLTSSSMTIGDVPVGTYATQMSIQTSIANQVNLLNMSGANLTFWDGGNMDNPGNGTIDGGTGTWKIGATNWTDKDGTLHGAWIDGQFAIFTSTAGTVTVDNSGGDIVIDGMHFAVDGYRIEGDAITLQDSEAIIRVGVGGGGGQSMSATIASELKGNASLTKMDHGTLILTADNTYTGGTTISEGTLQLGDGGATGSVKGDILNNSTLAVNRSDEYTLTSQVSGMGALVQNGSGTLILTGENSYSGGTTINEGTLQLGNAGTTGSIKGNVVNEGVLAVNRSDRIVLAGAIGGAGSFEQNGTGTTILTGENSYSGTTTINTGALQIGNGGSAGSINTDITNNGTLIFNRTGQLVFSKAINGLGSVVQDGAGTTVFTGVNNYTGVTLINAGTLQQKMNGSFSSVSDYSVGTKGILDLGGYKTILASLSNSGTVRLSNTPGAVINITGDYAGNGGIIIISAALNGDDSKADLLKVGGDTSGSTNLKVVNHGGLGAQTSNGIKVIEVGGQSSGVFTLQGDYVTKDGQQAVVAGAYAYSLHQNGVNTQDGDWYLRSELKDGSGPVINPGAPVYEGYAMTLQTLNKLPTLQQRVGNRFWNGAAKPVAGQGADAHGIPLVSSGEARALADQRGIWGRIEGGHNRFEANRSATGMKQDVNTVLMQAGIDGMLTETETGQLLGGFTAQYGKARGDIASSHGDGKIDTQGWGLGATLTWYGENGLYLDTQTQAMWYDSDLNSGTARQSLVNGNKGFGYALSFEAGKRIDLDASWSVTPQAQLVWSSVDFDTFNDAWGASVSNRNGDSLNARLGISADYRNAWRDTNGMIRRSNVYGIINLYQELMGAARVDVAGVDFANDSDRTWGGIGAGGTYSWNDDAYALYGEGSLNTSLNTFADSYTIKGTIGFKMKW